MANNDWEVVGEEPASPAVASSSLQPQQPENDWEVVGEEDLNPTDLMHPGDALSLATAPDNAFDLRHPVETKQNMDTALAFATPTEKDLLDKDYESPVVHKQTWGETLSQIPSQVRATAAKTIAGMTLEGEEEVALGESLGLNPESWQGLKKIKELKAKLPEIKRKHDNKEPLTPEEQKVVDTLYPTNPDIEQERATIAAANEDLQQAPNTQQNWKQRAVQNAATSTFVSLPALVTGILTRNPTLAAASAYQPQEAQSYADYRAQGLTPEKAKQHAAIDGVIEAGTELLPAHELFKTGSSAWKRLVNVMAAELPGESVATIGQQLNSQLAQVPGDATAQDVIDGLKAGAAQLPDTWAATILQAGSQHAIVHSVIGSGEHEEAPPAKPAEAKKRIEPTVEANAEPAAEATKSAPTQQSETARPTEAHIASGEELAALQALRKGQATPEQEATLEAKGMITRSETGTPILLPAGRRRLTELQSAQAVSNVPRQTNTPADSGEAQPTVGSEGEAAASQARAQPGGGESEAQKPGADGGSNPHGASAETFGEEVDYPPETERADLEAAKNGEATRGAIGLLAKRGLVKQLADGTAQLLPAGRRRLNELQTGKIEPDVEAEYSAEELAQETPQPKPVEVRPEERRNLKGKTVYVNGEPLVTTDDESALEASSDLEQHGVMRSTVAGQPIEVNVSPTDAQKGAGNYRKGHITYQGLDVAIENPKGSVRSGTDASGKKWESKIHADYGYVKGSESADGDHVDVFIGNNHDSDTAFVIDQTKENGSFDEHKVMLGYPSEDAAKKAYLKNYPKGWKGIGAITAMPISKFKEWVKSPEAKQPLAYKQKRSKYQESSNVLEAMARQAGWAEVGGRAITDEDSIKPQVTGRTKWLPHADWFKDAQGAAPLPKNINGHATREAVRKAIAGEKLTAAETRHLDAMLDAHRSGEEEAQRVASAEREHADLDAQLERIAIQMEHDINGDITELEPVDIQTLLKAFKRDERTSDDGVPFHRKDKAPTRKTLDLFGDNVDVKNQIKRLEAELDRRRNSGEENADTGKPGDLFSKNANKQIDIEDGVNEEQSKFELGPTQQTEMVERATFTENKTRKVTGRQKLTAPNQVDMFTAGKQEAVQSEPSPIHTRNKVKLATVGHFSSGLKKITSWQMAAHVIAPLRKSAQENMLALVVDKDNNPLAVLRHTIGTINSASVETWSLAGGVLQVPGAAKVYFAHNHPSGNVGQSEADRFVNMNLANALSGTPVRAMGMIVVGHGKTASWIPIHMADSARMPVVAEEDMEPMVAAARNKVKVPVQERQFRKFQNAFGASLTSPKMVKEFIGGALTNKNGSLKTGVVMLDNRHQPVGFIPMNREEMNKLRTKNIDTGSSMLLRAFAEANANTAIITAADDSYGLNVGSLLKAVQINVLDIFHKDSEGVLHSRAEAGQATGTSMYFHKTSTQEERYQQIAGVPNIPHETAVRNEVDRVSKLLPNANIHVSDTFNELPDDIRSRAIASGALDEHGNVTADAFYDPPTGKIVVISNEIEDPKSIESIILHEHVAHEGLRSMLDAPTRNEILDGVARDLESLVREKAADYGLRFADRDERRVAAEEVIAELAESHLLGREIPQKHRNIIQRVIKAVADYLRKAGILKYDEKFIASLLTDLHRHVNEGTATREVQAGAYRETPANAPTFPQTDGQGANEVVPDFAEYVDRARKALHEEGGGDEADVYSRALKEFDSREPLYQWEFNNNKAHFRVRGSEIGGYDLHALDSSVPAFAGNFPTLRLAQAATRDLIVRSGDSTEDETDRIIDAMPLSAEERAKFHKKPFFSTVESTLSTQKLQKASASQWLSTLKNTPGVKQEELDWIGLEDWLKGQDGTITKEQVHDFVRANAINVEEVLYSSVSKGMQEYATLQNKSNDIVVELSALGYISHFGPGGELLSLENNRTHDTYEISIQHEAKWMTSDRSPRQELNPKIAEAADRLLTISRRMEELQFTENIDVDEGAVQYAKWTTPGGKDYRELMLTLPKDFNGHKAEDAKILQRWATGYQKREDMETIQFSWRGQTYVTERQPGETAEQAIEHRLNDRKQGLGSGEDRPDTNYHGPHWEEPNVVAHVRFDERTDQEGKRVLYIHEIQSDWHQQGRKKGYAGGELTDEEKELHALNKRTWDANARITNAESARRSELEAQVGKSLRGKLTGVPDAPFKTSWPELSFKRMIRWATDNGFDRIAWATGAQNAERYDLSKEIHRIEFWDNASGGIGEASMEGETRHGSVNAYNKYNVNTINERVNSVEELEDLIGKELATKLLNSEPKKGRHAGLGIRIRELEGLDLKVGGEGMIGFYDDILPKMVAKLTKKWGGKVGQTHLTDKTGVIANDSIEKGAAVGAIPVHSIDVTPEMKEAASAGLPLFHKKSMVGVFRRRQAIQNGTFDLTEGSLTSRWWNLLVFKAQDRLYDLLRLQDQAKIFRSIAQIPDHMDAYLKETLFHGRVENRVAEYDKQFVHPLVEMIKSSGYNWQQVEDFLYARHAPEANARLVAINGGNPAFHSGMTDAEAQQVMSQLSAAGDIKKLQAIGAHIDAMTQWERTTLVTEGLEDAATVQEWENTYEHYVPLKGWAHNPELAEMPRKGRGFDTGGRTTKDRTGRTSRAGNILANIVAQAQSAIIRSEKAKVGRAFLDFVKANPAPRLYEVNTVEYHRYIDPATGLVKQGINPQFKLADNVVRVRVNGKDEHIVLNPADPQMMRLATAFKNLSATEMGLIFTFLHGVNRYLSTINTSLNPEFVLSNLLRDTQEAGINLQATEAKGLMPKIMADWRKSWSAIRVSESGGTAPYTGWWERFKKAGGKVGWIEHYKSPVDIEKKMLKEINRSGVIGNAAKGIELTLGWIERQNLAVENALRLATFKAGVEMGMTDERAAQIAKNLTINFNKRGDLGVAMNSLILFYNAGVQGTSTIIRSIKNPRARKYVYGLVAAGIIMDLINRFVAGTDDDDENRYDKIRSYDKERNIIVMLPKEARIKMASGDEIDHFKIPMPYGYNFFYYSGTKIGGALDYFTIGNKRRFEPTSDALDVTSAMFGAFNPIGGNQTPLESITLMQPYIQLSEERAWDGRPLMPPQPQYDIPVPDSQRYWKSASHGAREVASWMNEHTGGTEVTPGKIDVSPATIDYWWDFMLGGTGRFVSNAINATHDVVLDRKDLELGEVPFLRRIAGQTGDRDRQERFYSRMNEVQYVIKEKEVAREMKKYAKTDDELKPYVERIMYIENRYPIASSVEQEGRRAEAQMRQLRKEKRALQKQEGHMQESKRVERIDQLDERMKSVMDRFNRSWNEAEDAQRSPVETRDLIGQLGPIIDGKSRPDAVRALREAGKPATADLIAALPKDLRSQLRDLLEKEAAS